MAIQQGKTDSWVKSSYSGGNGACVEIKSPFVHAVAVRDSKNPAGPSLGFEPAAWQAFVGAVDSGSL